MINYDKLLELMGGDHAFAQKMIDSFKADLKQNLEEIRKFHRDDDNDLLSNSAHVLKTQSAYLGVGVMEEKCREIEYGAKTQMPKEELADLIEDLGKLATELLKEDNS